MTSIFKAVVASMRLPFVLLTPACLFLGVALATQQGVDWPWPVLCDAAVCGLCAHISVNMLNEYLDDRSGLDAKTTKTPFNGGSGALGNTPQAQKWVLFGGVLMLGITIATGVWLLATQQIWSLWPLGVLGVALIVLYTQFLNRQPWLCLMAPGLGLGVLMVLGTVKILGGDWTVSVLFAALVPFFMINGLLLINQLPDLEADRSVGRNHLAIAYSPSFCLRVFFVLAALTLVSVMAGVWLAAWPLVSLWVAMPVQLMVVAGLGVKRSYPYVQGMLPFMGLNVAATLLAPVLLGLIMLLF